MKGGQNIIKCLGVRHRTPHYRAPPSLALSELLSTSSTRNQPAVIMDDDSGMLHSTFLTVIQSSRLTTQFA